MASYFNSIKISCSALTQIFAVLFILAFKADSQYNQCSADENGYIFSDRLCSYWKECYQPLPDTLCTLRPLSYTSRHSGEYSISAVVSHQKKLYLALSSMVYPLVLGFQPWRYYYNPVEIYLENVELTQSTPLCFYKFDLENLNFSLAIAQPAGEIRLISFAMESVYENPAFTIEKIETIMLSSFKAGQQIINMTTSPKSIPESENAICDSNIWITGSSGLIRRWDIADNLFVNESIYDISSNEDVLCYGDGYAATYTGSIYHFDSSGFFLLDTQVCSFPLWNINNSAAVGDNGSLIVHQNQNWIFYTLDSANYRYFNLIKHPNGSAIELLDEDWNYHFHIYKNDPTFISLTSPESLITFVNTRPYIYSGIGLEQIEIATYDDDGNNRDPSICLCNADSCYYPIRVTTKDQAVKHAIIPGEKIPDDFKLYTCGTILSEPIIHFSNSAISLNLSPSSLTIHAKYEYFPEQYFNPHYPNICWSSGYYDSTFSWNKGDSLIYVVNNDTLVIKYGYDASVQEENAFTGQKAKMAYNIRGDTYSISVPTQFQNAQAQVTIYDLKGRVLKAIKSENKKTVEIHGIPANGIYYYRFSFSEIQSDIHKLQILK
ncbi:MAG: T9SS type A sorting domain-containing protein [Chitinivibrionales bacterium]|nr:T9SS type A sorting domain-containing protein [Chitinivibrionales bacterium]